MIEFNAEIMKKVEQKERNYYYLRKCIETYTCPKCGEHLQSHMAPGKPSTDVYECSSCGFTREETYPPQRERYED